MSLLRVATYNIHAGIGRDGCFDAQRIAHVINELQAQIIALHEVESESGDLGALDVRLQCRGLPLRVVATHLGLSRAERATQVSLLMERLDPADPTPTVLMGDMNEWVLWSRPLRQLHQWFGRTVSPATFPAGFPLFALDRLWVRPGNRLVRLYRHVTPLSRIASDHLPLVAEIDLS